jgi:hypothetical protein
MDWPTQVFASFAHFFRTSKTLPWSFLVNQFFTTALLWNKCVHSNRTLHCSFFFRILEHSDTTFVTNLS